MKVGVAFSDFVNTEKIRKHRYDDSPLGKPKIREVFLIVFLFLFLGILSIRLFFVQVIEGGYFRNLSDGNRIKTTIIHAPRGILFDRNNIPLVFNVPGFRKVENGKTTLLSRDKALPLIAKGQADLEIDSLRQYPYKDTFAHVLGYIGQISQEELSNQKYANYKMGDLIGKFGIEKQYENKLIGLDGKQLLEIDAEGKILRTLGQTDSIPGEDITLTLDAKLQEAAYQAMTDIKRGAVVVSTPKGEILTLLSSPSYDPNLFTLRSLDATSGQNKSSTPSAYGSIEDILSDSVNQPLLNRAIGGTYPPGSTFKLVTAASGLENKTIDEAFEVADNGVITVGAFSFSNWYFTEYGKTEGKVNIVKAIQRSNDIFFYKLAEMVGPDTVSEMAKRMGSGSKLGIDLEGEEPGVVPTTEWKKKEIGEQWYLGDTYHYGIGQGFLLTTPLQVNAWTQAIANMGALHKPYLLKTQPFDRAQDKNSKLKTKNLLSEKTFELIRQGMIESCNPGGVAWPLFEFRISAKGGSASGRKNEIDGKNFMEVPESTVSAKLRDYIKVSIACKTGTAQHGDATALPHAWITLWAPAYNPEIIVTVLAESSGQGSNVAAPVAKKILEEWFSR